MTQAVVGRPGGRLPLFLRRAIRGRLLYRLLAGMLVVSLLPLAAWSALVLAGFERLSSGAIADARALILQNEERRQLDRVRRQAAAVEAEVSRIEGSLALLRDYAEELFREPGSFGLYHAPAVYELRSDLGFLWNPYPSGGSLLIAGRAAATDPRAMQEARLTEWLEPMMKRLVNENPNISSAWFLSPHNYQRFYPWFDAASLIREGRLNPDRDLASAGALYRRSAAEYRPPPGGFGTRPPRFWVDTHLNLAEQWEVTAWSLVFVNGVWRGTVGLDVTVDRIVQNMLAALNLERPEMHAFLISPSGRLIAYQERGAADLGLAPDGDPGSWNPAEHNPELGKVVARMQAGDSGVARLTLGREEKLVFYAPVPSSRWSLGVVAPERVFIESVEPIAGTLTRGLEQLRLALLPAVALMLLATFGVAALLARRLTRPIGALTGAAERMAAGDLAQAVPPVGNDELGVLATTLEAMRERVRSSQEEILAWARELERRVADRTAELSARTAELATLNTIATTAARSLDLDALLADLLRTVRDELRFDAGAVFLPDREGRLVAAMRSDLLAGEEGESAWNALRPLLAQTVDRGGARFFPDLALEPSPAVAPLRAAGLLALALLPLRAQDEPAGVLALAARAPRPFAHQECALLLAVAAQIGVAVQNATLYARSREMAVVEERNRLAREIHDTIAQGLAGIVVQLEAAAGLLRRDPERALAELERARQTARESLQEARRSVWDLRPALLENLSLADALRRELFRFNQMTGVAVDFSVAGRARRLPARVEAGLLRVAQEALSNVHRHAAARRVTVTLTFGRGQVRLAVADDGQGFDPAGVGARADGHGFGLVGMRERVHLLGGELAVESAPGAGTKIEAKVRV